MRKQTLLLTAGLAAGLTAAAWAAADRSAATPYGDTTTACPDAQSEEQWVLPLSSGTGVQAAGDHIVNLQCSSGGWCWQTGTACCPDAPYNTIGPIAMGLLHAYNFTGDGAHLAAAELGGDYALSYEYSNGEPRFGSATPYFLWQLTLVNGDSAYSNHAEVWFFDELDAGTYGPSDYDTAGWIAAVEAARSGSLINLRPWEFFDLITTADAIGNTGQSDAFLDATIDGLETLDEDEAWDLLGLAGGMIGLGMSGTTTFDALSAPNFPAIDGINTLAELADVLIDYQNANGSWYWWSGVTPGDPSDEDTQTTAYTVMALLAAQQAGCGPYDAAIEDARAWMWSMQDPADGGFWGYGDGTNKNTEVIGEALSASTPVAETELESDYCNVPGGTLTVQLNVDVESGQLVRGGQFFLQYDNSVLTFTGATPNADFPTEYFEDDYPADGFLDYSVGVDAGDPPVSEPTNMATLTFTIASGADLCETADLVGFRWHDPPTQLAGEFGEAILLTTFDLEPVMIDSTEPVITTPPSDLLVNADAGLCTALVPFGGQYETFDNPPPLSDADDEGYWYPDRYPPHVFDSTVFDGDARLRHRISEFDSYGNRPGGYQSTFYNYQGRKYNVWLVSPVTLSVDLYIPASWEDDARHASIWATGYDATDTLSGYPIMGFTSNDPDDGFNPDPDPGEVEARFRAWKDEESDSGWVDMALPSDFTYDAWYTLEIDVFRDRYTYRVISASDVLEYTYYKTSEVAYLRDLMLQGYNFSDPTYPEGDTYDIHWDNCTLPLAATDNCDGPVVITYERDDDSALTLADPFPAGDTLVTWTAADACGNEDVWVQTVTVAGFNDLVVDVELSPTVVAGPFTRCITFELWDCSTNSSVTVQKTITFENGLGSATLDDVPCGVYDCITARDTLHTLRSTDDDDFGIVGAQYVADFTTGDQLVGGNLNDDEWIDILDYAIFTWQYLTDYTTGDTDCSTPFPHADINGDGTVDLASSDDFSFIQVNYLQGHEDNCCGMPGHPFMEGPVTDSQSAGPVTRISVHELKRRGQGHLSVGDLNGDGWLDEADVMLFMGGVRP
ncbi:MAG: cohesin domain-containing protein [Planctomycetota bacterium]|nr:cohesin domain-containing protein [Planctomycetota bacterium]